MERGRRIALDYGDARIGVAICDPDGILATPLPFLEARHPRLAENLSQLFAEFAPVAIYIGLPRNLSGEEGEAVAKVRSFASLVGEVSRAPIHFIDERLSTVDAQRRLHEAGKTAKESRSLIDSMAAVAILESGLAREAR